MSSPDYIHSSILDSHELTGQSVRIPATSYLVPLFTLIYLVLFHLLPPYHLDVPCYLTNRQRYCSVWSEKLGLFTISEACITVFILYKNNGSHNTESEGEE